MLGDGPNEDYSSDTTMINEIATMIPDISTTPERVNSSTKNIPFSTMKSSFAIVTSTSSRQTEQTTTTTGLTTKTTTTTTLSTTPKNLRPMPTVPKKRIEITTISSTSVIPKLKTTKQMFISSTAKPIKPIIKSKKSTNIIQNHSIPQTNESYFISLSIVIIGCGTVVLLVGYFVSKYSNKWNRYNSQSIEYKSNYYSKRMEEPLVDDDEYTSNDYINNACIIEERPLDNLSYGNIAVARPTSRINFKSHKLAKIRRPTSRISIRKHIDQYSDEQLLTEDGDESFDL